MEKKSQKTMVLEYMQEHGSIEPLQALSDLGCYRLGSRICDLRQDGYNIKTDLVTMKSKVTGNAVTFARYSLVN